MAAAGTASKGLAEQNRGSVKARHAAQVQIDRIRAIGRGELPQADPHDRRMPARRPGPETRGAAQIRALHAPRSGQSAIGR
ncbi:hypothetical protein D3105_02220 [Streptomyces globisporus]|uniref:Uncharacterized protein n=1 Tax=Streptomyces globisporus TaxID=1908 RepID=A0A423V678_STRGL|nr:hypothetical protein D3105_02220 [Streptomyces globisporus]